MVIAYVVGRVMNKNTQAKIDRKSWNVMQLWISAFLQIMREFSQSFLDYMLGRERLKREQAEENVELHETYEKWQKIEQSVTELPEQSPLIPVLQDYMDLLDKLKVCASLEEGN